MPGPTDVRAQDEINPDAGIEKPELGVFAKPVDTFVKPVSPEHSALGQLAGALKEFNPALDSLEKRFQEREEQQGTAKAEEAFAKDKGNWDQAVRSGDVPSFLHPYGRMAARERFGRMAGDKMANDIQADPDYILANSNATTMEQHDQAFAAARQKWEQTNLGHASHSDPLFQANYQGMAAQHTQDVRNKAVGEIEQNYVTLNGQHLRDELTTHLQDLHNQGVDGVEMQDELSSMLAGSGLPEKVQRGSIIAALDAYARKNEDVSAYDRADGIKIKGYDGKMYDMGNDPDMIKMRVAGIGEIVRTKYQAARLFNTELIQKQNGVRNDVLTDLQKAIEADPTTNVDLSPFFARYQAAGIGSKVNEIPRLMDALRHPPEATYNSVSKLTAAVRNPNLRRDDTGYITTGTLVHALEDGQINTADYRTLQAMVDKRDKKYGSGGRTAGNPDSLLNIHNRWYTQLKESMQEDTRQTNAVIRGDIGLAESRALADYSNAYDAYIAKNPDADPRDLQEFLENTALQLHKHYLRSSIGEGEKQVLEGSAEGPSPKIDIPDENAP